MRSLAACLGGRGCRCPGGGTDASPSHVLSLKSVASSANQKDQREWLASLQGGSARLVSVAQLH